MFTLFLDSGEAEYVKTCAKMSKIKTEKKPSWARARLMYFLFFIILLNIVSEK